MIFFLINQISPFFTSDAIMFYPMGNATVQFYVDTSAYSTDTPCISTEQDTPSLTKFSLTRYYSVGFAFSTTNLISSESPYSYI